MDLSVDASVELTIDRAVAGGRMLARHDGAVVLVSGAIPGERVKARVTQASRRVVLAETTEVLEASPDRRTPSCELTCGGMHYAHISYDRQRSLKAEVIVDAFRRLGHLTLASGPPVAASPEHGYRLRARLHVRQRRAGFFHEGTHTLCEASATGQLREDSHAAIAALLEAVDDRLADVQSLAIAENVNATQRVIHLDARPGARLDDVRLDPGRLDGVTGVTAMSAGGHVGTLSGSPHVSDTASDLFHGVPLVAADTTWTRGATAFFQGNRYLTGPLAAHVLHAAGDAARVVDLYAGVGLFAVAFAARGASVVAIEGDRAAVSDLARNAAPYRDRLLVEPHPVEQAVGRQPRERPDVVIVDPPRTGMSADALRGISAWRVPHVIYVSCDPPTLARDASRLREAGYALHAIDAFDLFPNTPHVETVAVFRLPNRGAAAT
jgi:23S rRNA (uracil1939-C5)-methyltransferase